MPKILALLCVVALATLIAGHSYGTELYDPSGRFAYTLPSGWQLRDNPKGRYSSMFRFKMAVDPKSSARIVVTVFNEGGVPLKARRDAAVQAYASKLRPGEQVLAAESVFETSSGQHAICLSFPSQSLHQWIFFFRRRDQTIVQVDCTTPPETSYDQLIDATMKTFRITRAQ